MELFHLPAPVWMLIALLVFFAGVGAIAVHSPAGDQLARSLDRQDRQQARSDDEEVIRASERHERELREAAERIDHERQAHECSRELEREQLQSTWNC